jgi:hypothetical protein
VCYNGYMEVTQHDEGGASDQDDLDEINRSTWDIVDATLGWEPYNAIIRVWDDLLHLPGASRGLGGHDEAGHG